MSRWLKKGLQLAKGHLAAATKATHHDAQKLAQANAASRPLVEGYYEAQAHEVFNNGRYEAIRQLGTGRYSHVWLANDLQEKSKVALKLLTTECYGTDHDIFEVEILNKIAEQQRLLPNAARTSHVIGSLDSFQLRGPAGEHMCIVMPVLGSTLGRQKHRFPNRRIPVKIVKEIARQLLQGLSFLHDDCRVIHTDLQPANICIEIGPGEIERMALGESADSVTPTVESTVSVKIIDFGVSSWVDKRLSDRIQPEHLRAPEVFLGAPWGPPCDIWSLGCLIVEFIQGVILFNGRASPRGTWTSEDDHLALHMEILGPMPSELLQRGIKTSEYFDEIGTLIRIPALKVMPLEEIIDGEEAPFQRPADMKKEEVPAFVSFLRSAFSLDPKSRGTAAQLLQHEWLHT